MKRFLPVLLCTFLLEFAPTAGAQETPEVPDTGESDDATSGDMDELEAELATELEQLEARQQGPAAGTSTTATTMSGPGGVRTARGLSNYFNPAISASGLVLAGGTNRSTHEESAGDEEHDHSERGDLSTGFHLQEVELAVSSIVDPFFRADLTLAAHHEHMHFEEAYVTTLAIPRANIRAGQFFANLGRHNILHTHAFPFLTAPLPWRALFGGHGLGDVGVSADILLPLPFFTEINLQAFAGEWAILGGSVDEAGVETDLREAEDLAYVGHLKTLFDLTDSATIELGGSYLGGPNGLGEWTHVIMGDLTFKWRPLEAERYTGIEWTTEYAWVDREGAPSDPKIGGGYTSLRYQFGQQWWIQARGALLGLPDGEEGRTWRAEGLLAFVPSEFSAIRLQYAYETLEEGDHDPVHEVFAQMNFAVGSHPTHAY